MAIVGYWRMNGNSNDASGNGNNGTDTNITYSKANGVLNGGAGFGGSNSKINKSSPSYDFGGKSQITISLLIKPTNVSHIGILWQFRNSSEATIQLYMNSQQIVFQRFSGADGTYIDKTSILTINWQNLVAKYDGSYLYLFINGKEIKTPVSATGNLNTLSSGYWQMGYNGTANFPYNGAEDEVKVDSVAWTNSQIKNEYSRIKGFF